MRRLARSLLFVLLLPVVACSAEESSAPAPATPPAASAPTPTPAPEPAQVAANEVTAAPAPATAPAVMPAAAGEPPSDHYSVLRSPQPVSTPGKIEVVEIFLYTCPHCYAFEPQLGAWRKRQPADVAFVRVPASFGPTGPLLAKTYYTAEALGVLDKMHPVLFDAIHKQRRALNTEDDVIKLFAENGVDPEAFRATYASFTVDSKARRAAQLEVAYGVTGVPAMAVNGKYGVGIAQALGPDGMLKVVDQLVAKERKAAR